MSEAFDTLCRDPDDDADLSFEVDGDFGRAAETQGEVGPFPRNMEKYNCMCLWARKRHPVVEQRLLDLARYGETFPWNRIEWGERDLGIIASGVVYEYAKEVFERASFLKLGMTYPLPGKMIQEFAKGVKKFW